MTSSPTSRQIPSVTITPAEPNLDTELTISLAGLPPDTRVTLRATQPGRDGRVWSAALDADTDAHGTAELIPHRDDPMALVSSMRPTADPCAATGALDPVPLRVGVEIFGRELAADSVLRRRIPEGLVRTEVTEQGLVGVMYSPDSPRRPTRAVLLLGGSEGGLHEDDAALLASHGHTALALAYFGVPGVPPTLHDIPLEYFGRAIDLLETRVGGGVIVIGGSKGGEAALLIGSRDPRVCGAVSVVGSGLSAQGIAGDVMTGSFLDILATPAASWTVDGTPLPYITAVITPELKAQVAAAEPVRLRDAYLPGLAAASAALVEACTIPVERINGPVLLLSGEDDQGYGTEFQRHAEHRLRAGQHPHPWEHVVHPGAGHLIAAPPYGPTTVSRFPGPGVVFEQGGTPEATARGRAETWRRILTFLDETPSGAAAATATATATATGRGLT